MTIGSTNNAKRHTASASQVLFPYDFRILDETHINVYQNGTLLTLTTHYTVSGVGESAGGNVTLVTGATANDLITILRSVTKTQETDYIENDPFPADSHEDALDKLTTAVQELEEKLDRALKLGVDSTTTGLTVPEPVAGRFTKWKSDLSGLENSVGGSGSGDVVGPGSNTDNAVARYSGTDGSVIQASNVIIDDSDNVTGVGTVDGRDIATDGTKLDTIEESADVTDYTNVNSSMSAPDANHVFNESGGDYDARWESDTQPNKLHMDSGLNILQTRPGTATSGNGQIQSTLYCSPTQAGLTASTSEEDLLSYTLPANALQNTGDALRIMWWGTTSADADNKTLKFYWDGATIYDSTALPANASQWLYECIILRTGSATQDIFQKFGYYNGAVIAPNFSSSLTGDLTGAVVVKCTGQNNTTATADGIINHGMLVELIPSA